MHDQPDIARTQNDGARAGLEVFDIDVSLRQAGRKHAGGTATGNLDLAAGALAASHGKDDRTPGELQHTGTAHERDGMDCGISRTLVHARRARALARIDSKYHAVQEQHDVGRAHLVDKALRVLGAGEFLLKVRQAKTWVNALAEDSARCCSRSTMATCAPAFCAASAAAIPAGPPPITTTSKACVCTASVAPASARSSRISSVAILAHPLQRSLNQPRSGIL